MVKKWNRNPRSKKEQPFLLKISKRSLADLFDLINHFNLDGTMIADIAFRVLAECMLPKHTTNTSPTENPKYNPDALKYSPLLQEILSKKDKGIKKGEKTYIGSARKPDRQAPKKEAQVPVRVSSIVKKILPPKRKDTTTHGT